MTNADTQKFKWELCHFTLKWFSSHSTEVKSKGTFNLNSELIINILPFPLPLLTLESCCKS